MGVFDRLLTGRTHALMTHSASLPFNPYSPGPQWPQFVADDLLTEELKKSLPLSRAQAIGIPAVSKVRNLLVASIAKYPLRAIRSNADGTETDVTTDNAWLYRTNSSVSPYERMAWTVDDLIFYGASLWLVDRGAPVDERRPIQNAEWCPQATWSIDRDENQQWAVFVDGVPIAEDRYILINSPFEGLLNIAQRTLRGARDVEDSWTGRAKNPIPLIDLHRVDDEMDDEDVEKMVTKWATARTNPNGAIGSTPAGVEVNTYGEVDPALMIEGRNAIRTDIGSFLNVRAAMLDGTIGVDSLTYTTLEGTGNSFYEFDLPFTMDPITARLSLDDVVPRGTRIRFEKFSADNSPATGIPTKD
jgi:hypothetical protein